MVRIKQWIKFLEKVQSGDLNKVHKSFPNPVILAARIEFIGVKLLIVEGGYGEEMDMIEVDVYHKQAINRYDAIFHYETSPSVELPKEDRKKNVKKLFRKSGKK